MAEREDRRVRRTRELLRDALLALIVEKGYDRVTVQDIIDRADVGRSTFYAHFRDKEDLLLSGFDEFEAELERAVASSDEAAGPRAASWPSLAVIDHVAHYRSVSSMLGARGSTVATRRLRRVVSDLVRRHLEARVQGGPTRVPLDVAVEFAVGSLLGLVDWWLDNDRPYAPEELDEMYRRLADPGLRAAVRSRP